MNWFSNDFQDTLPEQLTICCLTDCNSASVGYVYPSELYTTYISMLCLILEVVFNFDSIFSSDKVSLMPLHMPEWFWFCRLLKARWSRPWRRVRWARRGSGKCWWCDKRSEAISRSPQNCPLRSALDRTVLWNVYIHECLL